MSRRAISWPISSMGWRTLVRCGVVDMAIAMSSKPTTATSAGIRRPDAAITARALAAIRSDAAKTASMSGRVASRRSIAAALPSWVNSPMASSVLSSARPPSARASR